MKPLLALTALVPLMAFSAACGSGGGSSASDYPSDPTVVAVYFAESHTCKEGRQYVSKKPVSPEFKTCGFTEDYIDHPDCLAHKTSEGSTGGVDVLIVPVGCGDDHGGEIYLAKESGLWKVVNANF